MIQRFLQFVGGKLLRADKNLLMKIDNPGAILSSKRTMVIHPDNKTFTSEERETITDLLIKE